MTKYLIENIGETEEFVHPKGEKKPVALQRGQNIIGEFNDADLKAMNGSTHLRVSKRNPKADEPPPEPAPAETGDEPAHELSKAEQKAPSAKA